ncbi:hypothetical protein [Tardiphaga sp. OK245]|uniref:hypothetical protein n=1 Tax=Tardiphaga sp. OK245 TaxID=1855306 RepID=UPI0008A79112|nr:hypothetical protein [Tardiphaga sp. OK245]SEI04746.1 hypothetical protein SAMN05216367_3232 [Tardiphaga sp. OK245]
MSDLALSNAQKRRDDLASRINQLSQSLEDCRKEIASIDQFIAAWHHYADGGQHSPSIPVNTHYTQGSMTLNSVVNSARIIPPKNPDRETVGRAAWDIIVKRGRPVMRGELFNELGKRGIQIYGKDPEMVFSTMMWRMQEHFVRLPKFGYWKRNEPWAPAGYVPGATVEDDGEDQKIFQNTIFDPASVADA